MGGQSSLKSAVALGLTGAIAIAIYLFVTGSRTTDPGTPDGAVADRTESVRNDDSQPDLLPGSARSEPPIDPASDSGAAASPEAEDSPPETATGPSGNNSLGSVRETEDELPPRADPEAQQLSARVFRVIEEVQIRQLDGQWEEALNEMNALYSEFDTLSPFEQATLLNYYTNTLIRLEMWQESIIAFSEMLTVPDLRPDVNARALLALGQLNARTGDSQAAAGYYIEWLAFTEGMEGLEDQTRRVREQLDAIIDTRR